MEKNFVKHISILKSNFLPPFYIFYTDVFYTDDLIKVKTLWKNKTYIRLAVSTVAYVSNGSDLDAGEHYSQSGMTGLNYYF